MPGPRKTKRWAAVAEPPVAGNSGTGVYRVTDYGAVGDGVTDDAAAIQRALDAIPLDAQLHFPNGQYLITRPIDITQRVRIVGASTRGTVIRCSATAWSGSEMMRNWTDADWAAGNNGSRPNTTASPQYYPQIESLRFDTNDNAGVTCLAWVHMQETAFYRDLAFRADSGDCIAAALYSNSDSQGSHNGGSINGITCYGAGWQHELYVNASGSDLHVSDWTSANALHSDSPFYFKLIDVTLDNMHLEAWLDDDAPAEAAVIEFDGFGLVFRDSLYSMHADMPRPLLSATNPNISGFQRTAPLIAGIEVYNEGSAFSFTGDLILDASQPTRP